MTFTSNKQRKAVMAKMRQGNTIVAPLIVKLSPVKQQFIKEKIKKNIREGSEPRQAVAIAFGQARRKFGNAALTKRT